MRGTKRGRSTPSTPPTRSATTRCAIYTRKSTEEGLDQDFNTLDAQREAAEAYITSQRHEGWEALPVRYDDGGFSGANTDRPAFQRLLADVEAGRVDAIAVYKIDRLTRSLLDFARIMEVLDRKRVALVSVTQQFNTASSMGRLVLHVLLSFAQFEREMIAERTRDKMSAARRKGKWVGGMPGLGYDVAPGGGSLVVNEEEAARVRDIFALYLERQSLVATAAELRRRGWTTKSWTTRSGRPHAGSPFDRSNLFRMLANVIYTGKVNHKGTVFPGEHPAIVSPEVWRKAQALLRFNGRTGGASVRNKHGALLRGMLRCTPCDSGMVHAYTQKGGKRYRYYACLRAQKRGWASCPTKSLPALEVERFVVDRIRAIGKDREVVKETLRAAREQHGAETRRIEGERQATEKDLQRLTADLRRALREGNPSNPSNPSRLADLEERVRNAEQRLTTLREEAIRVDREAIDEKDLTTALSAFDGTWDALFPREQARIVRLLVERVGYDGAKGTLEVTLRPTGIRRLAEEMGAAATGSPESGEVAR